MVKISLSAQISHVYQKTGDVIVMMTVEITPTSKTVVSISIRGRKGGSCAQFTAIKDGKSRITIITFRVSRFTENNIVEEE